MTMMVGAGHLGGQVLSHRNVLARDWFCLVRCARVPTSVTVPVIGSSGAERAAMREGPATRTGLGATRCQPSATEVAAASVVSATATATRAAAVAATT